MTSAPATLHLQAAEVDLPGGVNALLPHTDPSGVWVREGEGLIGLGAAASATATGPRRFAELAAFWESVAVAEADFGAESSVETDTTPESGISSSGAGLLTGFVSVTFSADSSYASHLVVPEVLIRHDDAATTLITATGEPEPLSETLARHGLELGEVGALPQLLPSGPALSLPATALKPGTQSERQHLSAVSAGLSAIAQGTVEKLVLARDVVVSAEAPLPLGAVLARLAQAYPQTWTYRVGEVLGATPEMLVRVRGAQLSSRVLAGTISRRDDAAGLVGDAKQHREHDLAVQSLLNGLGPLTESLQSPADPGVLELPNVYHLVSDVSGRLAADPSGRLPGPLQVAEAAHPTAAVCGTPSAAAAQLITQLEAMDRGPYAGPVGWLDAAGNADFGIALRGGLLEDESTIRICAGGGIVEGSEPESELAETEIKLTPMLGALGL
ncbi:isochorismate synthase [Nesterenkonia alkaliphila]|uniref:Isochorismate synthase n=1 Tax=Nesterenkonia alkaliphila TaxID=1463631 RepID=A0A7K1UFV5_9MICC|nr:chorismate-binding protein [Nesterenkonia alkaliphila]MVT25274.1 isochorismate synthase [Nesterenkonia alkaliphila]GFZ91680.1 isochorismate synthase [Nesterenkonia alkaliphila]